MTESRLPPTDWTILRTIDCHAAGEPLRVVVDGFPELEGKTILERRRHAREHHDHLRRALMLEPRGHADMYGCLLVPPETDDGDLGVIFTHNDGYSTMCGHGVIGLVTVALECGLVPPPDDGVLRLDTPAGRVEARAEKEGQRVRSVSFRNVPSFVLRRDAGVRVPGLGAVRTDIAFGGAFYAFVDARSLDLDLVPTSHGRILELGRRIKEATVGAYVIEHPAGDPDLGFLYGTIFVAPSPEPGVHSRHVCVFADGQVDRSPTGTGVSARIALLHTRGEAKLGERLTIDSLLGTRFDVEALETTTVGDTPAVVPEVTGSAHITGRNELWIDPEDPLREGFLLR